MGIFATDQNGAPYLYDPSAKVPASSSSASSVGASSAQNYTDYRYLKDIIGMLGELENTSAEKSIIAQKELMNLSNSFTAQQANIDRVFQQQSADKAMRFTADQAAIDREFQKESASAAMAFSADQAQQQMDFQERMSATAYQRAVKDMQAAGINPILAYTQGGASSPAGASGTAFSASGRGANGSSASGRAAVSAGGSAAKANVASVIGSVLQSNANIVSQLISGNVSIRNTNMNNLTNKYIGTMNASVRLLDSLIPW